MEFKDWIKQVIASGNLCNGYEDKVSKAASRKQLMDLVLDANGISYLCEMDELGYTLPYEVICEEFKHYINGKYVAEFINSKGNGYNSSLYCCNNEDIEVNTTLTCLLGCNIQNLRIREKDFVRIYCDRNCIIEVDIPMSSIAIVETWGDAKVSFNNIGRVELIKH